MPHYKDGRTAFIGDVVKGIGYNVKDEHGKPKVIIGTVIGVTPGSKACNIQVAHVLPFPIANDDPLVPLGAKGETSACTLGCGANGGKDGPKWGAMLSLEYGECAQFELVLGITVACRIEGKWMQVRPFMTGAEIIAACKADSQYRVYRSRGNEYWKDEQLGWAEVYKILEGDNFYCVPPATGGGVSTDW